MGRRLALDKKGAGPRQASPSTNWLTVPNIYANDGAVMRTLQMRALGTALTESRNS